MKTLNEQLLEACQKRDIRIAQELLEQGADPDTQDRWGQTTFLLAAKNGDIPMLKLLIQHGANPFITDHYGRNALYYAIKNQQHDTAQFLMTKLRFDPNIKDHLGQTPFLLATEMGDIKMLKILAQNGAKPYITDDKGRDALYYAIKERQYDTVQYLISELKFNPDIQNGFENASFLFAAELGDIQMLKLLYELGANPHITDRQGQNVLHYAVKYRQYDAAQYHITELHIDPNTQDRDGVSPFLLAIINGDIQMLKLLYELGANPYITDRQGQTALHYAVKYRQYDIAQYLITQLQLDPNVQDRNGITPVMLAAENDDIPMIQRLIELGANPYATDHYGENAIHYAIKNGKYDTVEYFITQLNLDPNIQDDLGRTPFFLAVQKGDTPIIQRLIQLGANPNIPNHRCKKTTQNRITLEKPQPSTITL